MADISRRGFLGGLASFGAVGAFPAPPAFSGAPLLTLGLLSDIHFARRLPKPGSPDVYDGERLFRKALAWFDEQRVDAVAVCGDLADQGMVEELAAVARAWDDAFPGGKGADGRSVERLFIMGNHDWVGFKYGRGVEKHFGADWMKHTIHHNCAKVWKELFREDFSPIWRKEVKGFSFVGAHWTAGDCKGREEACVPGLAEWFGKNGGTLDPSRPFFFLQHPAPKGTCHGPWLWGQDAGQATGVLSRFPNAVALSGHSHASVGDDRFIWRGPFTSVGAGSLKYTDTTRSAHQGMLVKVYGDRIVFERREFGDMGLIADDVEIPVPAKPADWKDLAAKSEAPRFREGAALAVSLGKAGGGAKGGAPGVLSISIPPADANPRAKAFEFIVSLAGADGRRDRKRAFASGFDMSRDSKAAHSPTMFRIALDRLSASGACDVEVVPRNSLGRAGAPLRAKIELPAKPAAKA